MPESIEQEVNISRLQEENRRLRKAVAELSVLNDIATTISSTRTLDEIVESIVQKCVKHLRVEQGAVMLLDEKDLDSPFHTMVRQADTSMIRLPFRLDDQLTGWMLKNQKPLLVNDFAKDERFQKIGAENFPIRSLLSVPLLLKGRMIGLLAVFNKRAAEAFSEEDQRLLSIIAAQSAQIIENARLYEEEQALKLIQEEMRLAHEIQLNLLPKKPPDIPGYDVAGISIPAKDIGGDYYDFIAIDDDRYAFCLGDVTGKGLPAALLMANLQATIRTQTLLKANPRDCMKWSNSLLYRNTDPQKFVTAFYGIINTKSHGLSYCNAGHDNPYIFRQNEPPLRLDTGGICLGFLEDWDYKEASLEFQPGNVMLLYSDGIPEAFNENEEEFGEERLEQLMNQIKDKPASEIINDIINSVREHVRGFPQTDDITMVVIKRLPV